MRLVKFRRRLWSKVTHPATYVVKTGLKSSFTLFRNLCCTPVCNQINSQIESRASVSGISSPAETPEGTKDKGAWCFPSAGRTLSLWDRALRVGPQRRRRRWKREDEEEEEGDGESTEHVMLQTNPCVTAGSPASAELSIAQRPRRERLPSLHLAWLLGLRGVLGLVISQICCASGYSSVIAHLLSRWVYSLLSLRHYFKALPIHLE